MAAGFWQEILNLVEPGGTSDASYYSEGRAQAGEWGNIISVAFERTTPNSPERQQFVDLLEGVGFWQPTDDRNYWVGLNQDASADIATLASAAETRLPGIGDAPAGGGEREAGGDVTVAPGAPAEEGQAEEGVGAGGTDPETQLTILTGKEMKWYFDSNSGKWYVEYGLPNSDRNMIFEATPEQMDNLFGANYRPTDYDTASLRNLTARSGSTFGGNVAEMEGTGTFEAEVVRVQTLALDEGRLPDWAAESGTAMDIIYTAQAEGKSTDWTLQQLSNTPEFKVRFPGIDNLIKDGNLSLAEGITGFLEYEAGVNAARKASGLGGTSSPEQVGNLLTAGHSLTVINSTVQGYNRMAKFAPAMEAFNQVLAANGQAEIASIDEMLAFVSGRSSAEIYDLYEASSIQEAAVGAGLGDVFSVQDAIQASYASNQTLETATAGMQKAAEMMLRMRHEIDINQFDLTSEELIDINLGQAPRSGRSQAEIHESINRAVLSATGELKKRTQPFVAFGSGGTPEAASLRAARQQS